MPNRPDIAVPPAEMPLWRDGRPLKRWRWVGCFSEDVLLCGAIALTDDGKIWGGSTRPTRAAAELAAIQGCQKRTKVQCQVKGAECNK